MCQNKCKHHQTSIPINGDNNYTFQHLRGVNSYFFIFVQKKTSPWELLDPRTKNDTDKTQDIRMPYVGNGYV